MNMERNGDIKAYAREHGVFLWQVGEVMGFKSPASITVYLRRELTDEEKARIYAIVDDLTEGRK